MKVLISISMFIVLWISLMIIVSWVLHLGMTRNLNLCPMGYGTASFGRFRREFCQYEWGYSGRGLVAIRHENTTTIEIGHGIVKFGNVGMAMRTPIDYIRLYLFVKRYIKRNFLVDLPTDIWRNDDTYNDLNLAPTEETMTDARRDL